MEDDFFNRPDWMEELIEIAPISQKHQRNVEISMQTNDFDFYESEAPDTKKEYVYFDPEINTLFIVTHMSMLDICTVESDLDWENFKFKKLFYGADDTRMMIKGWVALGIL
jgi:hypothetical protein